MLLHLYHPLYPCKFFALDMNYGQCSDGTTQMQNANLTCFLFNELMKRDYQGKLGALVFNEKLFPSQEKNAKCKLLPPT